MSKVIYKAILIVLLIAIATTIIILKINEIDNKDNEILEEIETLKQHINEIKDQVEIMSIGIVFNADDLRQLSNITIEQLDKKIREYKL